MSNVVVVDDSEEEEESNVVFVDDVASEEEEEAASALGSFKRVRDGATMTTKEFERALNKAVDAEWGSWEAMEGTQAMREANGTLRKKHLPVGSQHMASTMQMAMYGRARASFVERAIDAMKITKRDSFFDIGSGVGSVVMQVAATVGCPSRGVELIVARHEIAVRMLQLLRNELRPRELRDVELLNGSFTDPGPFETARRSSVLFVNNAHGVFGERSVTKGPALNQYVARLVCGTRNGSRTLCFDQLPALQTPPINDCFSCETRASEPGATSWTTASRSRTTFYVYTKLADQWKCAHCSARNNLLAPDGEIRAMCGHCTAMGRESYPVRQNRTMKAGMSFAKDSSDEERG